MKTLRTYFLSAVLAFAVSAASIQQAQAFLPAVIVGIGSTAVRQAGLNLVFSVIARGAAANDPYVKTTATIAKTRLAQNLARSKIGFWPAAIAAGVFLLPDSWFYSEQEGKLMISEPQTKASQCIDAVNWSCNGVGYGAERVWTTSKSVGACTINGAEYSNCVDITTFFSGRDSTGGVCFSKCVGYVHRVAYGEPRLRPVTAEEIEEHVIPQIATSPEGLVDSLSKSDLASVFDGAEVPYNPAIANPSIASLVDAYNQGILQTTDPLAANYVDPETYEQIKAWAEAAADADNAAISDGELSALNEKMKQPITQAQYEESNKKFSDAVDSVTSSLPDNNSDLESIDDSFNKLDGIITDLPNTTLPAPADISVPQYVDCQQITLSDGNGHDLVFPSPEQCAKIETFKEGFGYFLAVSVVFLLGMQLLTRPHG